MKPNIPPADRETLLREVMQDLRRGDRSEGQVLRHLRREVLGLSQQRYAELVGVSRRTLTDIEADRGNVTMAMLNRVFRPLGLRVGLVPRDQGLLQPPE